MTPVVFVAILGFAAVLLLLLGVAEEAEDGAGGRFFVGGAKWRLSLPPPDML